MSISCQWFCVEHFNGFAELPIVAADVAALHLRCVGNAISSFRYFLNIFVVVAEMNKNMDSDWNQPNQTNESHKFWTNDRKIRRFICQQSISSDWMICVYDMERSFIQLKHFWCEKRNVHVQHSVFLFLWVRAKNSFAFPVDSFGIVVFSRVWSVCVRWTYA